MDEPHEWTPEYFSWDSWKVGQWAYLFLELRFTAGKEQMVIVSIMSKIHPDFDDPQIYGVTVIQN